MGKLREEVKAQEAHTIDIWQSSSFNDGNVKHTCSLSKLSGRTGLLPAFYQNKNKNKEIKLKPTIFLISKLNNITINNETLDQQVHLLLLVNIMGPFAVSAICCIAARKPRSSRKVISTSSKRIKGLTSL